MKSIKFPVYFATAYLLMYVLMAHLPATQFLVPWLFMFSPCAVLWMAFDLLKDEAEGKKIFEDDYYEDALVE